MFYTRTEASLLSGVQAVLYSLWRDLPSFIIDFVFVFFYSYPCIVLVVVSILIWFFFTRPEPAVAAVSFKNDATERRWRFP